MDDQVRVDEDEHVAVRAGRALVARRRGPRQPRVRDDHDVLRRLVGRVDRRHAALQRGRRVRGRHDRDEP